MSNPLKKLQPNGSFTIENVNDFSYLYFPLFNQRGMLSTITPDLAGDTKLDLNHFVTVPVSVEDLRHGLFGRHAFFLVDDELYSTSGKTPAQQIKRDQVTLNAGVLFHSVTRTSSIYQITTTSFIPTRLDHVELHRVEYTNTSKKSQRVKPTLMTPLYSRSADSIRDHRHVTALLNRATIIQNGIINQPTLSFDERGHLVNHHVYGMVSMSSHHESVHQYWPVLEEFVGEGFDLSYPLIPRVSLKNDYEIGQVVGGYEVSSGLEYQEISLAAGQSITLEFAILVNTSKDSLIHQASDVLKKHRFDELYHETQEDWSLYSSQLDMQLGTPEMTGWLKWVSLQPLMRRVYGNSFLPHHDYGRGGRGWRDLWQDLLAQIISQPSNVRQAILNNVAGIRVDGSNATIIGHLPGEFLADRNKIVRVWSDHGAWGFITTNFYLHRTGDMSLFFEKRPYFRDQFSHYTHRFHHDVVLHPTCYETTASGEVYQGTLLEHLLTQNIIPYFNVGQHGNIRLEDADWNDGLDMAKEQGETVAFSALYAGNLKELAKWVLYLNQIGHTSIELFEELVELLRHFEEENVSKKQAALQRFFDQVQKNVSGLTINVPSHIVAHQLQVMASNLEKHINTHEWLQSSNPQMGWFNGYYDNFGKQLESAKIGEERMTLTGQVFPLMAKITSKERIEQIVQAVQKHLYEPAYKGVRLNTPLGEDHHHIGRLMGFAYGHKENGALFSHMAVMYAYSLLDNDFVKEGSKVLDEIFEYTSSMNSSKIYPGIPEYIDQRGRGVYHYL
ncbi:MAG: cellobiose phosphorylase, partial [Candidatus Izemoplasmatales bacterium]|nr:cellobiose phosphorylase [Candidatus Izemoplasmatales bacterium]